MRVRGAGAGSSRDIAVAMAGAGVCASWRWRVYGGDVLFTGARSTPLSSMMMKADQPVDGLLNARSLDLPSV